MTITLDSIQSTSITSDTYLVTLLVVGFVGIVLTIVAVATSEGTRLLMLAGGIIFTAILFLGASAVLGTLEAQDLKENLAVAFEEATGGSYSLSTGETRPLVPNASANVIFTPEEGPARTCVLSTDDVKYTMTCPTSDVVEVVLD